MISGWLFFKTVGSLALVLAAFLGLAYGLKRLLKLHGGPVSQTMEVLSRQSFGPRHHLIMVKVSGERKVLVGISPQNMSLLCVDDPVEQGGAPSRDAGDNI